MAVDMTPQPGDYSINLPVTFDYKGGRSGNSKWKVIISIFDVLLTIIFIAGTVVNPELELYQKVLFAVGIFYLGLFILRFFVFRELYYSDVFETLKAEDFKLRLDYIWQIFDIDTEYPYISYFKNGYKGIFVRMEKDAITGKPDSNIFDHYQSIGDAYNVCHSLNMNMVHIDYMDNVGNDARMEKLYNELAFVENPDMQAMLIDIYNNLQDEMSRNYASFDIYLFLTRDNLKNFVYNVQSVANTMLSGNFITYSIIDRYDIARVCTSLFNFHEFSILDACESTMSGEVNSGIIPISLTHEDGTVDILNKTVAEKTIEQSTRERKRKEAEEEALNKRHAARRAKREAKKGLSSSKKKDEADDDFNLF